MKTEIKSLAGFRRFLAEPGATTQITRHDWSTRPFFKHDNLEAFFAPRKVRKLQTNAVCFEDEDARGSWLYWDRSMAKSFRFDGTDTVTVVLNEARGEVMQYKCWTEGA